MKRIIFSSWCNVDRYFADKSRSLRRSALCGLLQHCFIHIQILIHLWIRLEDKEEEMPMIRENKLSRIQAQTRRA